MDWTHGQHHQNFDDKNVSLQVHLTIIEISMMRTYHQKFNECEGKKLKTLFFQ